MSFENDFYSEVDRAKKYNWWRVPVVLFWVIIFLIGMGAYYVYSLVKTEQIMPPAKIVDQDAKSIQEVINYATTDPNFSQSVTLSQDELSSYLFLLTENTSKNIKNLQVQIEPDQIVLFGRLLAPIETTIEYQIVPSVVDGKIFLSVESIEIGQLHLSKTMADLFAKSYVDFITTAINQPSSLQIENVYLTDGEVTISAKSKGSKVNSNADSSQTDSNPVSVP